MQSGIGNPLNYLTRCNSLATFKQLHAQTIINGLFNRDPNYTAVKLVSFLSSSLHNLDYARTLFFGIISRANVYLWTAMISSYTNHKTHLTRDGFGVFKLMLEIGPRPNRYTLSSVIKVCSLAKAIEEGKQIHAFVEKAGFEGFVYVCGAMVDMYGKFGLVEYARKVFEGTPERNVVICNAMLDCYVKGNDVVTAREVFDGMSERDVVSWNSLLYGYSVEGNMIVARDLFGKMTDKNVNSWNLIIFGYSRKGEWREAIEIFTNMLYMQIKPDSATLSILMSACAQLGCLKVAMQIHGLLCKSFIEMNSHVGNSIVHMYAKCGSISNASQVFDEMCTKDLVSYNVIIGAFADHGLGEEAINIYGKMLKDGLEPDRITLLALLTACSHAGLVEAGEHYFNTIIRDFAIEPLVDHYACMVDLYGRAGLIKDAFRLIQTMPMKPHAGVWGTLLNACRKHGNVQIGKIAARELVKIEPANPGNYVILSNMCANDRLWDEVAGVRGLMRGNKVAKTTACSWIEVDIEVREFIAGDFNHPNLGEIYDTLKHLSLQLA